MDCWICNHQKDLLLKKQNLIVYNQRKYDKEKTKLFYQILIHKKLSRHFMERRGTVVNYLTKSCLLNCANVYIRTIKQVNLKKLLNYSMVYSFLGIFETNGINLCQIFVHAVISLTQIFICSSYYVHELELHGQWLVKL